MPSLRERVQGRFDFDKPPAISFKGGVSRTQQQFKEEADVNFIVNRAKKTGLLTDPRRPGTREPKFGDFTLVPNFHQQQAQIAQATQEFERLPALIRERFKNDVGTFMEFIGDPENVEEAVKLGLLPESRLAKKSMEERRGEGHATRTAEALEQEEVTTEDEIESSESSRKVAPVLPKRPVTGSVAARGKAKA